MSRAEPPDRRPIVVTAADEKYWRSLWQFLCSVERQGEVHRCEFIAYDLGLNAKSRARLARRFPWCQFQAFEFRRYPPHVAVLRNYAWKPIIISDVMNIAAGPLLWFDSATILRTSLEAILREIRVSGLYTLKGQTALARHCDPLTLEALAVPREWFHVPEHVTGVLGFDAAHPVACEIVKKWRDLALVSAYIAPRDPPLAYHRWEQALLTIVLCEFAAKSKISLADQEIDISSRHPIRWMSSRNKVAVWVPTWADLFCRAYYHAYKRADRAVLSLREWRRRMGGIARWRREHFSIFLRRVGDGGMRRLALPGWSYWADPFLIQQQGRMWLFAEEFRYSENRGRLCAVALDDNLSAGVPCEAMSLPVHASFPFIFKYQDDIYLLPETHELGTVDLYRCENFPQHWTLARRLLYGIDAADSVLIPWEGRWYLLTSIRDEAASSRRRLAIYHSDSLLSEDWRSHPVNDERLYQDEPFSSMRNAGAPFFVDGSLIRPVQRNKAYYGEAIGFMRIDRLSPTEFAEVPYDAPMPADLIGSRSIHHIAICGDLIAWDVRDRAKS